MADNLTLFKDVFLPNITGATVTYRKWRSSYPAEAKAWDAYLTKLLAGQAPAPPSPTSRFGKALVAASRMAVQPAVVVTGNLGAGQTLTAVVP